MNANRFCKLILIEAASLASNGNSSANKLLYFGAIHSNPYQT